MKPFYYLLLLIFLFAGNLLAQTGSITLNFSGKDATTGNVVPLESVKVSNLTHGGDTTVWGGVPTLVIQESSGIFEFNKRQNPSFTLEPNFPNPFAATTTVSIRLQNQQQLKIALYDQHGAKSANLAQVFSRGVHRFEVAVPQNKLYLLSVSDGSATETLKLLSTWGNTCGIDYKGQAENLQLKTGKETTAFVFQSGDTLEFRVNAVGYSEYTISDSPSASTNYFFSLQPITIELPPTVSTAAVTNITATTASSGGFISDEGSAAVIARGVCWSISPNPTTANSFTNDGNGTGAFSSTISGLAENTIYYVRAYAINAFGTSYGNEVAFNTAINGFFATTYVDYRQVLLEEFTGHLCVNCPEASKLAHDLSGELDHKLIVYSIHAGAFALPIPGTLFDTDYRNSVGNMLHTDFTIFANPLALIDRVKHNGIYQITMGDWETVVMNELQMPNMVNMRVSNTYIMDSNYVKVEIESEFVEQLSGQFKLAVYLVEDNLVSAQLNNDPSIGGDTLYNFVHRNVLRDAVSPVYGDFIGVDGNITVGEVYKNEYTYQLDNDWLVDHCRIVAFIGRWNSLYNFVDIIQTVELKVKANN